jgi:hypothetical protein
VKRECRGRSERDYISGGENASLSAAVKQEPQNFNFLIIGELHNFERILWPSQQEV